MITPEISVLMPAYNAEKYLGVALQSILDQTFTAFELIVIDDGSSDRTWEIIQQYAGRDERIVALKNEKNLKISATLNKGLALARGKYLARMDADDWSYSDRLKKQYDFMESHPDIVLSGGVLEICSEDLKKISLRTYQLEDREIRKKIFRYSPFAHPLIICRMLALENVRYNNRLFDAEDYDFYFQAGLAGKFGNLADTLLKLRVNDSSMSQLHGARQERLTLFIRLKAVAEYGYRASVGDVLYSLAQAASLFIIPRRWKFWLFNFFRK